MVQYFSGLYRGLLFLLCFFLNCCNCYNKNTLHRTHQSQNKYYFTSKKKYFSVTSNLTLRLTLSMPVKTAEVQVYTFISFLGKRDWGRGVCATDTCNVSKAMFLVAPNISKTQLSSICTTRMSLGDTLERVSHFGRLSERRQRGISLSVVLLLTVYICSCPVSRCEQASL